VPAVAAPHVRRRRLLERLAAAEERPLILVSAPAGYGKTSLVAEWITSCEADAKTAWVTFEDRDEGVWQGFVGCLETMGVEVSAAAYHRTGTRVDPRTLSSLASRVAGQGSRLRVVIDGHDVVSDGVGRDLDFLLRHSGHQLQLVLLTRSDPLLPLYRYRLDGTIAELRMRDLAFSDEEAAALFTAAGVRLAESSVRAVNARAEGWAVGLRFASAMLKEREDVDAAVAQVVGDTGNIAEYLVAEVLDLQPPEVRRQLLSTSIADMVRPGLDAALGGSSAPRNLSLLARDNAFVEQVPGQAGCYRYHPFFRDLLRATLSYEAPRALERLHHVAADWFAEQGEVEEAVRQLTAIDDWDEAARLAAGGPGLGALVLQGSSGALPGVLRDMPTTTSGPMAPLVRAALSLGQGETAQTGRALAHAHRAIDRVRGDRDAEVALSVLDALHARNDDDVETAGEIADRAMNAIAATAGTGVYPDPVLDGLVRASRGIAAIRAGDLAGAGALFTEVAAAASELEPVLAAESDGFLALLGCFRGRLSHAAGLAGQALAAAERIGLSPEERPCAASLALAWVAVERCDLPAAMEHANQAGRSHFLGGDPVTRVVLAVVRSRIEIARGNVPRALPIVREAIAEAPADSWAADLLHLEVARDALAQGQLELVEEQLARSPGQAEAVLLEVQLALDRGDDPDVDEVQALIHASPLLHVQVSGLLALASARLRGGSPDRARVAVDRALRLAAGETLRRPFHQAAPAVREMLRSDPELLARHQWLGTADRAPGSGTRAQRPAPSHTTPLVEELTPKELEVLGHLAELLSTEEIADAMFVSVNTVRTHVRGILRKLGVPRRNAAVRRARELELIAS
jgi:LuxR family maltose regulon positive regulatory protein